MKNGLSCRGSLSDAGEENEAGGREKAAVEKERAVRIMQKGREKERASGLQVAGRLQADQGRLIFECLLKMR